MSSPQNPFRTFNIKIACLVGSDWNKKPQGLNFLRRVLVDEPEKENLRKSTLRHAAEALWKELQNHPPRVFENFEMQLLETFLSNANLMWKTLNEFRDRRLAYIKKSGGDDVEMGFCSRMILEEMLDEASGCQLMADKLDQLACRSTPRGSLDLVRGTEITKPVGFGEFVFAKAHLVHTRRHRNHQWEKDWEEAEKSWKAKEEQGEQAMDNGSFLQQMASDDSQFGSAAVRHVTQLDATSLALCSVCAFAAMLLLRLCARRCKRGRGAQVGNRAPSSRYGTLLPVSKADGEHVGQC
ncbi:unnamed protein product [Amoebophrya sp. A25]|nr:unnamed protein product [Amoebophrya sp. A25]|eukprot:GSA25T00008137001.1